MKTRTATSNSNGSNLQVGLAIPARLARVGVAALALTAVSAGIFGAGSASADGPRKPGQPAQTQVVQGTQITQVQAPGNSTFGKLTTTRVARVEAQSTGDGKFNQAQCDAAAVSINEGIKAKEGWAKLGNLEFSFDSAKEVDRQMNQAMDNGCVIVY